MVRDTYLAMMPAELQDQLKQYATLYDSVFSAIKTVGDALCKVKPKLRRGFTEEVFKMEFVTNCRVIADTFPKITFIDTLFLGIIMNESFTEDQFRDNFTTETAFLDNPSILKACILYDEQTSKASTLVPSVTTPYLDSISLFYKVYILMKESLDLKAENPVARGIYDKLMLTYANIVRTEGKGIVKPFVPPFFDESNFSDKRNSKNERSFLKEGNKAPSINTDNSPNIISKTDSQTFDALINELNSLIGLQTIKNDVYYQMNMVKAQRIRAERGLKTVPVSLHLVFTGNPGTGKTTVARLIAKLYKEIGVLKTGQLVEVDRGGLVAGYVGQTAIKTQEKINEAIGGVLFIDEAYSLVKGGNDFGMEAIETLLKAMEDHRDELVVIVAGYPDLMETFINSNPGLRSRFSRFIHFPDYNEEELYQIFEMMCSKYDYSLTPGAKEKVKARIHFEKENQKRNFANARTVRNIFESVVTRQSVRTTNTSSHEELTLITENDVV